MKVWIDGKNLDEEKVRVPILAHSLQYSDAVFEGIRAYKTKKGVAIFRLKEHVQRFFESMKIYAMEPRMSKKEVEEGIVSNLRENIKENGEQDYYIRPFAFYPNPQIGLSQRGELSIAVASIPFGKYLKSEGVKAIVSSWRRIDSASMPPKAKGSANYLNSILATIEAKQKGADEAILLSYNGYVSEGPGENIFVVKDNVLKTPSEDDSVLVGITRRSIFEFSKDLGIEAREEHISREELYTADELFFCGTAAEITPILEVDGRKITEGIGPITKKVKEKYEKIVRGEDKKYIGWLTFV
ncbi:MAG: branched-chain amino acid transaminase [Candidatus Micrarchaeia archaeon]